MVGISTILFFCTLLQERTFVAVFDFLLHEFHSQRQCWALSISKWCETALVSRNLKVSLFFYFRISEDSGFKGGPRPQLRQTSSDVTSCNETQLAERSPTRAATRPTTPSVMRKRIRRFQARGARTPIKRRPCRRRARSRPPTMSLRRIRKTSRCRIRIRKVPASGVEQGQRLLSNVLSCANVCRLAHSCKSIFRFDFMFLFFYFLCKIKMKTRLKLLTFNSAC